MGDVEVAAHTGVLALCMQGRPRCPAIAAFAIKGYADSNRGEGRDARTENQTRPCPSRPRRCRGAASERRAREGLPRASTQTLPLDMRALWPRIHPCQPAVV